ncbi:hypothetical protein LSH36_201g04015 [Paralvinella palmiformis]|uniref:mitogen-activated protein kinase kinase n=1 Tax=Paralvinella palmiformis TaxID=53620 RepID=A0AAD9JPV5_9ANNE|nr:hypothetical protein LSH36_201g04015 [Paralvinella palmiformis]
MAANGNSDSQAAYSRKMLRLDFGSGSFGDKSGNTLASRGHLTQIERLKSRGIDRESTGKLKISPELEFDFTADDLQDQGEIGRGNYGTVNKMYHEKSNTIMAVKRIRSTVEEKEQKQLLMDLDVVMRSNDCPFIVRFYGALFKEGDCWICMELMSISLDKFYKFVHGTLHSRIPESIIGKVAVATVNALNYLKEELKIIHRDVKPSNILLDKSGNIKLCDFGISGQLVDSIAKTRDAGCRPYMAPERIDPHKSSKGYDIRSDVWSLGITLVEVATGKFPYPKWNTVFEQLTQVVQGDPPRLHDDDERFSSEFKNFINMWTQAGGKQKWKIKFKFKKSLIKSRQQRPKYDQLLQDPFIMRAKEADVNVASYISGVLDQIPQDKLNLMDSSSSNSGGNSDP